MLLAIALVFAVVNGANDGGAMVAAGLKTPGLRPLTAMLLLAVAVGVTPIVLGTRVAATLATGLVSAPAGRHAAVVGAGVVAAMLVVAVLSLRGLPTSLTLGVVGGIVGAGLGAGLPVSWATVGFVIVVGVAAPALGALLGSGLSRLPVWLLGRQVSSRRWWGVQTAAFGAQSLAYAANDGQKMYAVLAVASASTAAQPTLAPGHLVALAALFAAGMLIGLRPAAGMLGSGVLRATPREELVAEFSSASAVLGSAALGAPVSMTQSLSGALIGAGLTRGYRQVRWRAAARLASAWVITLPASAAASAVLVPLGRILS